MANDMALEKKIDLLVDKFDSISTKVDGLAANFDSMSTKVDGMAANFDSMSTKVDGLATNFDSMSTKVDGLATNFDRMTTKVDGLAADVSGLKNDVGELKTKVAVGFEESHRLLKLGLEGLAGLEETTVDRFDTMSAEHGKQFELLETFGVHVRKRVEKIEARPKARRRARN